MNSEKILRLAGAKGRTGLSRSTIYRLLAAGKFPQPIKLGARSIGFVESEIDAWIIERIRLGRENAALMRP